MRRIFSALLILAMLLSFAACGSKNKEGTVEPVIPTASPAATPEATPTPDPEETPEPAPAIAITIETESGTRDVGGFDVATFSYDYPVIEISEDAEGDFTEILDWAESVKNESQLIVQDVCAEAEDAYTHAAHWFTTSPPKCWVQILRKSRFMRMLFMRYRQPRKQATMWLVFMTKASLRIGRP